jgi:hypothetical protein
MKPGVYAVDITIKAMPLKHGTKLVPVNKVLKRWPVGIKEDGSLVDEYFIPRVIKKENINKYRITYQIDSEVFLSTFNYRV